MDPDASEILEVRRALAEERALREALEADLQRSAQIGQELLLKNEELEQVVKEHAEKTAQVARRASNVEPVRRACTVPLGPKEATAEEEESDSELPTSQLLRRGRRAGKTVMVEELMSANLSLHDDLMRLKDEQRQAGLNGYIEAREEGIQNVDEEESNLLNELQHRVSILESGRRQLQKELGASQEKATSQWTLDYPPAFAYFEWLLSQVAVRVDPAMLQVRNLEYASWPTVTFQRLSVVAGDFVLLAGGLAVGGPQTAAVLLWNSALILVDHIHFQYNGMMLGLLLLSAAAIEKGKIYLGALLFCLLLCMKHIFLYVAPVYFVYLLRGHCGASCWPPRLLLGNLIRLGAVVVSTILVLMSPFLSLQQLEQIARRLFPFGRGLTHAYWAPNCWALYNTFDRVLAKVMGAAGASSSTAGFAEVYESAVLWTVPPRATFILTLLAYCPLLTKIWHCTGPAGARRGSFATYVALGSAVAFTFGWHVHEKAILMVTIPLLSAPSLSASNFVLSSVACFSVMPLLPERMPETSIKWLLFLCGGLVEVLLKDRPLLGHAGRWSWILLGASYALLGAYRDFGGHSLLFRGRMEFLPLLLTSDFSAILAARAQRLEEELEATRISLHLAQGQLAALEEVNRALRTSQQALDTERAKLASLLEAADARCVHLEQELEQTTLARARASRKSTGSILRMEDEVVAGEAGGASLAVELAQDGQESLEEALRVDCVKVASELRTEVGALSRATASCKAWLVAARKLCDEKIPVPALSGERSDDEASPLGCTCQHVLTQALQTIWPKRRQGRRCRLSPHPIHARGFMPPFELGPLIGGDKERTGFPKPPAMGDIREADLLLADEESLSRLDDHRAGWMPRWLVTLMSTAVVALFVVVATVRGTTGKGKPDMLCAARNCYSASEGRIAFPQLSESDIPEGSCSRPSTFCSRDDDHIEYHDCDGDEILDPFCNSAEKLKFGFLSSANGCRNNWPNGLCQNQDEPSYIASLHVVPSPSNEITIIHFNDVYQLAGVFEHGMRKGGMSRAAYVIEQARKRNPDRTFVVFAGDLLSPSVLSDLFEGEQMVDILNFLNLTAASLGNHEFDFGVETLRKRIQESRFVWLNTNLLDEAGALLPGTQHHKIMDIPFSPRWSEGGDVKTTRVCLFGVAYDVRETMFKDRHRVNYVDSLAAAQKEAKILRDEHKCKVVLALTHQFASEDCKLSKALGKSVDLILGSSIFLD
eukprot:s529_g9.t2